MIYEEQEIPENIREQVSYWQYRVIRRDVPSGIILSVHEVYFDNNDRPLIMTEYPAEVVAMTLEEDLEEDDNLGDLAETFLEKTYDEIQEAFENPTMPLSAIPYSFLRNGEEERCETS